MHQSMLLPEEQIVLPNNKIQQHELPKPSPIHAIELPTTSVTAVSLIIEKIHQNVNTIENSQQAVIPFEPNFNDQEVSNFD